MLDQLQKAIKLAKKTGDRLIVFDQNNPNDTYVLLSLEEYEKIAADKSDFPNLTEEDVIDKINRNAAILKNTEENRNFQEENSDYLSGGGEFAAEEPQTEDYKEEEEYFNNFQPMEESQDSKEEKRQGKKSRNFWKIPEERKEAAEEIIEEDRQYLEEIEI